MAALSPTVALTAASVVQQSNGPAVDQSAARADRQDRTETPAAVAAPSPAAEELDTADGTRGRDADGRGRLVDIRV